MKPPLGGRRGSATLVAFVATGLLFFNTAQWRNGDLAHLREARRFWEDLIVAETSHERPDADLYSIDSAEGSGLRWAFERYVAKEAGREGLRPWEFWRTIEVKPNFLWARIVTRPGDDRGRALLLTRGFHFLGGCAPFLPFWLGALALVPLLFWVSWELGSWGLAFPLFLVSSPFFVEALSLPYSAVGFYALSLVALVPLALLAVREEPRSAFGFAVRVAVAGSFFALCVLCRAGTALEVPGFALAILLAAHRVARGKRGWFLGVALLVLFMSPYLLVRLPEHRLPWMAVWQGLGDFDSEKGHEFLDSSAREVLRDSEVTVTTRADLEGPENEPVFRRLFLKDVESAPGWYLGLLAKRLGATLVQYPLWRSLDVSAETRRTDRIMRVYYGMTTHADSVGVGPIRLHIPMLLLALPTLALVGLSFASRRWDEVYVLGLVALAALVMPVVITTASALEPESFILVYLLGAAFFLGRVFSSPRSESPEKRDPARERT